MTCCTFWPIGLYHFSCRFTNANIIHKSPEWTLIAVVLLLVWVFRHYWWCSQYPLKYHPFCWPKLKNDMPKIKRLLFLNPFDSDIILVSSERFAFQESELLQILLKQWQRLIHCESGSFSLKRYSVFYWKRIYCSCGWWA